MSGDFRAERDRDWEVRACVAIGVSCRSDESHRISSYCNLELFTRDMNRAALATRILGYTLMLVALRTTTLEGAAQPLSDDEMETHPSLSIYPARSTRVQSFQKVIRNIRAFSVKSDDPELLLSIAGVFRNPLLPSCLEQLRISDLRIGTTIVDLMLLRHADEVAVHVQRRVGKVEVVVIH